jgi:hypothetical protein
MFAENVFSTNILAKISDFQENFCENEHLRETKFCEFSSNFGRISAFRENPQKKLVSTIVNIESLRIL